MYTIPEEDFTCIGQRIRNRRRELGFTQADLACELDMSVTHVCRVEKGCRPGLDMLTELARVLHLSMDELLGLPFEHNATMDAMARCLAGRTHAEQQMALTMVSQMLAELDELEAQRRKHKPRKRRKPDAQQDPSFDNQRVEIYRT